jgi:hypothetical protein
VNGALKNWTSRESLEEMSAVLGGNFMSRKQMREASRDVNEKASAGPSAWSKKMLDKMGWKEGQGLGKQSDGMAEPVKVVKKDDNSGIGMKAQQSVRLIEGHENDWWSREFAASAARLNALGGGSDSDDSSDSSDSDDDVSAAAPRADPSKPMTSRERDLELFRACGGRQLGMRARGAQKGKLKRSEDSNFGAVHGTGNGAASPPPKKKRKRRSNKGNFLIPRQRLRQELLDLLEPGTVEWGCNFESYQSSISTVAAEDEVSPEQSISNSSQTPSPSESLIHSPSR